MKLTRYLATLLFFSLTASSAFAQDVQPTEEEMEQAKAQLLRQERAAEKKRLKALEAKATEADKVYVFGVGSNFNDSTIYVTEIAEISSMKLQKKTKFLPYRSVFSLQLREHIESSYSKVNETCCMFYADKRKKLAKRFYKLKKRYLDEGNWQIVMIGQDQFKFEKPQFVDNVAL